MKLFPPSRMLKKKGKWLPFINEKKNDSHYLNRTQVPFFMLNFLNKYMARELIRQKILLSKKEGLVFCESIGNARSEEKIQKISNLLFYLKGNLSTVT